MELEDLSNLSIHTVLSKKDEERIYLDKRGSFVFYKKKHDGRRIGEYKDDFAKWLVNAEIVCK